ncbi:hypothetical protein BDF22DRAFT_683908 [Syncephalis plumigaleata]|nr:hypothetical protein BDF22DRAFT_683908 [Syncephalis plumigaleata]
MSTDNTPLRRVSHKAPAPCISDVIQTVIQANTRSEQLVELETLRQSIHEKQYSVDVIVHELASIRALIKWWSRQENRFIMQSVMNILYVIYQQTSTIEPFIAPYLELLEHTCDTSYLTQDTSSTRALPTKVDHQECLLHFIYVLLRDIRRQVKRASNSDSSIAMHRPLLVWVAQHVNSWSESVDIKGQTRMALLAILAEWIRLQGKYSLTMDEPVVVEQITHIMQFTAQAYRDEADFSAYHRLLDLLTTILKDTSIKLTRNVVSTIHVIANAFHFNEWESNDEDNNYNCNRMLDDQSDFCFDNETRQWPPISLMRRLVLAFLYYINHPTLHQMLMNTEGNYPHISNNKVCRIMHLLLTNNNNDNNAYMSYY